MKPVLTLHGPQGPAAHKTGLVADSPHSGRDYPADFGHACPRDVLRQAEDAWLDQLLDFLPGIGVPLLQAEFPRAYIDPNRRAPMAAPPDSARLADNGPPEDYPDFGLVRRLVSPRHPVPVYDRPVGITEVFNRVARCHAPYHAALQDMLNDAQARAGHVVHLDFHSMPSTFSGGYTENRYDIIIGTRDGATADAALLSALKQRFEDKGYAVGVNVSGYRGGEIIRRAGDPAAGRHSLQVEINRALYMDEQSLQKHAGFQKLRDDLRDVVSGFGHDCDAHFAADNAPQSPPPSARGSQFFGGWLPRL